MKAPLANGGLSPVGTHTVPAGQHSSAPAQFVALGHGQQPVRVAEKAIGEHVAVAGQRALVQSSPARQSRGHGSAEKAAGEGAGAAAAAAAAAKWTRGTRRAVFKSIKV
jgi:hypothetical protein